MKRVQDRKKMRREYLRKKAKAYAKLAVGGVMFVPLVLGVLLCLMGILAEWVVGGDNGEQFKEQIVTISLFLGGSVILAALARWSLLAANQGYQEVVGETVNVDTRHLPAEEVLVRGAEEPFAPNDTLLRATGKEVETKPEELLHTV